MKRIAERPPALEAFGSAYLKYMKSTWQGQLSKHYHYGFNSIDIVSKMRMGERTHGVISIVTSHPVLPG